MDPETVYVQHPDSAYRQTFVILKDIIGSVAHLEGKQGRHRPRSDVCHGAEGHVGGWEGVEGITAG